MAKRFKHRWRENGKHRQRTFPTRQHRDMFVWELARRGDRPPEILFQDFASKWLVDHAQVMMAESSQIVLKRVIDRHLLPAFGAVALSELRRSHLLDLRASLSVKERQRGSKPLSPKSINDILVLARRILNAAVEWGHIPANPFQGVKPIPLVRKQPAFWTREQRDRFLVFARRMDPAFAELVLVACETGMRRGELQALERGQLDFDRRQIIVDASFSLQTGRRMDRTKNRDFGSVPMTAAVFETLKSRMLSPHDGSVFDRTLFVTPHRKLKKIAMAAGVPALGMHGLRHSFASIRVMEGVPLHTVGRLLRQRSASAPLIYSHLAPDYLRDEIERGCAPICTRSDAPEAQVINLTK